MVIVGVGSIGLWCAKRLIDDGFCTPEQLVLLEKQPGIGGLWSSTSFANVGARVQILEPMLRLIDPPKEQGEYWPEMTPRDDFVREMDYLVQAYRLKDRLQCNVEVVGVTETEDPKTGPVRVSCRRENGEPFELQASWALLTVGGLQKQREVDFPGEGKFKGPIVYGQGLEVDALAAKDGFRGKSVICLGNGAQSVENARTALLHGANQVTMVARKANLVASGFFMYVLYLNEDRLQRIADQRAERKDGRAPPRAKRHPEVERGAKFGYVAGLREVQRHSYEAAGLGDTLADARANLGSGGNPTVSDLYFIASSLGLLRTEIAETPWEFTEEGMFLPSTGKRIAADMIIKNFGYDGYEPARQLERLTGVSKMVSPCWVGPTGRIAFMVPNRNPEIGGSVFAAAADMLNSTGGVNNIIDPTLETFLYFARRPEERRAFMGQAPTPAGKAAGPEVPIHEDSMITMSKGVWAAMQWAPEIVGANVQARRADFNRRVSSRYGPLKFLEENQRVWQDYCQRITGNAGAVPFPWTELMGKLQTDPTLLNHLLTRAHVGEAPFTPGPPPSSYSRL